jgi:hypothetical protein
VIGKNYPVTKISGKKLSEHKNKLAFGLFSEGQIRAPELYISDQAKISDLSKWYGKKTKHTITKTTEMVESQTWKEVYFCKFGP